MSQATDMATLRRCLDCGTLNNTFVNESCYNCGSEFDLEWSV